MALNPFPLKILSVVLAPVLLSPSAFALEFPQTGGAGAPSGGTSGGGVRGSSACVTSEPGLSLMALKPSEPENYIGTTATDTPTIFFYVPKTQALTAEFALVDKKGNEIYTQNLKLSDKSGLVDVKMKLPQLPQGVTNTEYTWQFVLVCNPNDRGADMWVEGQIRHVSLSSEQTAALAAEKDLLKKAKLLADAKIWYDTLAIAAQLRSVDSQPWESLLKSVNLDSLSETPLLDLSSRVGSP